MSELPLDEVPGFGEISEAAHDAAKGSVVYLTEHGERIAAIVPAELAATLENMPLEQAAELLEDLADAVEAREIRAEIEAGEPVIAWEQVKAEAGL